MSKRQKHEFQVKFVKLLNLLLMAAPVIIWMHHFLGFVYYGQSLYTRLFFFTCLFCLVYYLLGKTYGAFLMSINRISEMIYSQAIAFLVSDLIFYILVWVMTGRVVALDKVLLAGLLQLLVSICWCYLAHKWYFSAFHAKNSVVVYDMRPTLDHSLKEHGLEKKFHITKNLHISKVLNQMNELDGADIVFLSGVHSKDRNKILKYCVSNDIMAYVIPRVGDILMSGARTEYLAHLPMLAVERYNPSFLYTAGKRVFDIVVSGTAAVLLSPVFLITSIAIKAQDGGPVFYKQKRLTKDGKVFDIYKFRSMRTDAEKDGKAVLSSGDVDPRITPVGRFIRKVRIDELPQLLNILKGDLSIVGPRPERPEIAAQYEEVIPEFRLRLQGKAGLTGLAQVYGKYNTTPYDKLQMDLMYFAKPSFLEDLRICFATVKILFMPESTEGVAQGADNALGMDAAYYQAPDDRDLQSLPAAHHVQKENPEKSDPENK